MAPGGWHTGNRVSIIRDLLPLALSNLIELATEILAAELTSAHYFKMMRSLSGPNEGLFLF